MYFNDDADTSPASDARCNMLKLPPRATLMQSIFNSTKLHHPEVQGAKTLITSPLSLIHLSPQHMTTISPSTFAT